MIYEILKVGRSTDSLDDPIFDNLSYYAEEKVDGVGAMMLWDPEGNLMVLTPKRDVTKCFPEEFQCMPCMAGWILHVEVVAGRTSSDVATFLSAKGWQVAENPGVVILDTLRTDGCGDFRSAPFIRRRSMGALAASALRYVAPGGFTVHQPDWSLTKKREFARQLIDAGGEGVVLKDINAPYEDACNWVKFKAVRTVDCAVRSYVDGNGKYAGGLGALVLELKDGRKWVQIGTCSGMSDEERVSLKERLDAGKSFVAEVAFQCWTNGGKLRHPRFIQIRQSKKLSDCTWAAQGPGGRS